VKAIADRFVVLRDGATVGSGDVATTSTGQIVELMVGKTVQDLYPRTARKAGDAVLSIRDLSGRVKPQNASLALHRGEVLGIAGLIGAGRTELLRAIFGLDVVRRGEVRVGHVQFSRRSPAQRWRRGLGMLSEDRKNEGLALTMSIADNLTLSDFSPFGHFGFIRPRSQQMAANMWADALQLKRRSVTQTVGELSGGNQQKVAIARLLHHDVDVLLLDEPTRGIDVGSKATIYRLIDELATGKHGKPRTVLMVSSYFPELLGVCDRIAVMSRGILGDARPVSTWTEHALMLEATGTVAESSAA